MSRIVIDGFEGGDLSGWGNLGASVIVPSGPMGLRNAGCCQLTYGSGITRNLPTPKSELYLHCRVLFADVRDGLTVTFFNNANRLGWVLLQGSAVPAAQLFGPGGTHGGGALITGESVGLEIHYKPDSTAAGLFTVKLNGVVVADVAGIGTSDYTLPINNITFTATTSFAHIHVDDFILDDAAWIGDAFVCGLFPSGAGVSAQFTPSAGSNYACVDESPANDADWVATNTADQIDFYAAGDLPAEAYSIKGIAVQARAAITGTAVCAHLALGIRPGTVAAFSGDQAVTHDSFGPVTGIWETNPDSSAPFTPAAINGMQIGLKSRV